MGGWKDGGWLSVPDIPSTRQSQSIKYLLLTLGFFLDLSGDVGGQRLLLCFVF